MQPTIAQALAGAGLDVIDARALLRHVCGVDDAYLIAHADDSLSVTQTAAYQELIARRVAGEPIAYIVGTREFFSLDFIVTPAVLIPRPETELLVELALEHVSIDSTSSVLDAGTGSGCIAMTIAKHRPHARIVAVDRSAASLAVARANSDRHQTSNVELMQSDWFAALDNERFDLIVANPPYIAAGDPHLLSGDLRAEPGGALVGGADGLEEIRAIVYAAPNHLKAGGVLVFEHGYDQAPRCRELLSAAGLEEVFSRRDIAGIERVSGGRWRGPS
ncbi:MAG TPA: peptide chain release factor N(5)-glutamine methyltransferase [Burkholderiales bacterium]|jgi:release factor glutamine methyltransferase|nr:peptide chain release factor N(5)-glutamine methyltransferase [Burkholderiales bacterium]